MLHSCLNCLTNLFFPFLPWLTVSCPSFLSGKRRRWKGKMEEKKSRKNNCSTELTSSPWKQSALRTLTGEFVEAMELTMGRVCRKWDVCWDSPDSGVNFWTLYLTIDSEKKKKKNWYYDPSEEGQDLLWVGNKPFHKMSIALEHSGLLQVAFSDVWGHNLNLQEKLVCLAGSRGVCIPSVWSWRSSGFLVCPSHHKTKTAVCLLIQLFKNYS